VSEQKKIDFNFSWIFQIFFRIFHLLIANFFFYSMCFLFSNLLSYLDDQQKELNINFQSSAIVL